ncbi:MAG: hypothetical protein A3A27_02120 [Candidatus Wildermuthbacteria bacterium RIFCSPLOWO2_01_FULL_47_18]|uniref:DUF2788 domain-containing protein n=1 Tax=Candidatus Wildermuthbacteria bacterium RIFCSPLOWO2_01_FULL_47_18 TaxID=1802460 RepID=A0A1G2RGY5_9BACT|nr:MAG: hypothetical protein A3A27_02120 [Candidatus Wildermuthbacteria bacterium RIFCSPLOWO2_01_FULL_47_18]
MDLVLKIYFAIAVMYGLYLTVELSRDMKESKGWGTAIGVAVLMVVSGMFLIIGMTWIHPAYRALDDF